MALCICKYLIVLMTSLNHTRLNQIDLFCAGGLNGYHKPLQQKTQPIHDSNLLPEYETTFLKAFSGSTIPSSTFTFKQCNKRTKIDIFVCRTFSKRTRKPNVHRFLKDAHCVHAGQIKHKKLNSSYRKTTINCTQTHSTNNHTKRSDFCIWKAIFKVGTRKPVKRNQYPLIASSSKERNLRDPRRWNSTRPIPIGLLQPLTKSGSQRTRHEPLTKPGVEDSLAEFPEDPLLLPQSSKTNWKKERVRRSKMAELALKHGRNSSKRHFEGHKANHIGPMDDNGISNGSIAQNQLPMLMDPRGQAADNSHVTKLRHPNSRKRKIGSSVTAVEGKAAILPCDSSAPKKGDYPILLIWLKEGEHTPLLSVDFDKEGDEHPHVGRDELSALSQRALIHLKGESNKLTSPLIKKGYNVPSGSLELSPAEFADRGVFRCRVNFLHSPTRNERINLTVIAPPRFLEIEWEKEGSWVPATGGTVGPLWEGDQLKLLCRTSPSWPPPSVLWTERRQLNFKGESEPSSEYILEYGNKDTRYWPSKQPPLIGAVRMLEMESLSRSDHRLELWCHSSNTNLSRPVAKRVEVDLALPVLAIELDPLPNMTSNDLVEGHCTVSGSYPPPVIRWKLGKKELKNSKFWISKDGNVTMASVKFSPTSKDDQSLLSCLARNPLLTSKARDKEKWTSKDVKLNVEYAPTVEARLGRSLNKSRIKEGDDVYFECLVRSNPPPHVIYWTHEGKKIEMSNGVFMSNGNLVIQGVRTNQSGTYRCTVANTRGKAKSGLVTLLVKYAPKCQHSSVLNFSVAKLERVRILCNVSANPVDITYNWKFNNTAEVVDVSADRYSSNGTLSVLNYSPMNELDYGMLLCWGKNEIGKQEEPCVFIVKVAGKPDPPHGCKVKTAGISSLRVRCLPGNDGGDSQIFHLQVYRDSVRGDAVVEVTSPDPDFLVVNLQPNTCYRLLAMSSNKRGESRFARKIIGCTSALSGPREETSAEATRERSPTRSLAFNIFITLSLCGLALTIVIGLLGLWACFQFKKRRRRRRRNAPSLDSPKTGEDISIGEQEEGGKECGQISGVESVEAVASC